MGMQFKCKSDDLKKSIAIVEKAVSQKSSLPVLENIFLELKGFRTLKSKTSAPIPFRYSLFEAFSAKYVENPDPTIVIWSPFFKHLGVIQFNGVSLIGFKLAVCSYNHLSSI